MTWISALGIAGLATLVLGVVATSLRARAALVLGLLALGCAERAFAQREAEHELQVVSTMAAYVKHEIKSRAFVVETVRAPGWQWPACLASVAGLLALGLFLTRRRGRPGAWLASLAVGWLGFALVLALEKTAAPADLVGDAADLAVAFAATLCCACLLARPGRRIVPFFAQLVLFASAVRLPLAFFAAWATQSRAGTHLDVSSITFFVNPFLQRSIEVQPGSTDQLAWLVWLPQLLVLPMASFFVAGGVGFAVLMFALHPPTPPAVAAR